MQFLRMTGWVLIFWGSLAIVSSFAHENYIEMGVAFVLTFIIVLTLTGKKETVYGITYGDVEILKAWQASEGFRQFCCRSRINPHIELVALIPTKFGWVCPKCDYKQPYSIVEEGLIQEGMPEDGR